MYLQIIRQNRVVFSSIGFKHSEIDLVNP